MPLCAASATAAGVAGPNELPTAAEAPYPREPGQETLVLAITTKEAVARLPCCRRKPGASRRPSPRWKPRPRGGLEMASCEIKLSKAGSIPLSISLQACFEPTKRTRAHPAGAGAVSIGFVLTLMYLPPRFAQATPWVGAHPGVRTPNSEGRRARVCGQRVRGLDRVW
jgi:hypothetical protein